MCSQLSATNGHESQLPAEVMSVPWCAALPPPAALVLGSYLTTIGFGFGLPFSIALFPQNSSPAYSR